jgi:fibronectin type 3 domain-containing protein
LDLDLRAGPAPAPWNESEWAGHAQRETPTRLVKIPPPTKNSAEGEVAEYQFSSAAWTGKDIVIAARVSGENGKASNWSTLLTLPIIAPLPKPADLKATPAANGIRLTWRAPAGHFRILRRAQGDEAFAGLAVTTAPEYLDATAALGKTYAYQVLAYTEVGPHQEAQSDLSNEETCFYKDTFPPAPPAGVRALASAASIELSWDANTEPDLAGYRVYRSTNGGGFEKIADVNEIPAYSDRAVERGKTYRYAITAIDKSGNESGRSAEVEGSLQ